MQHLSAFQEMHHFGTSSPSCSSSVITSSTGPLPCLRKQFRKQSWCRIVPPLPALLLVVPVMRGFRNSADYPEEQQQQEHRSNWKPYGGGRGGGRGGRDQDEQQHRGGEESIDGFRERYRFREGFAAGAGAGAAKVWRNSQFEFRAGSGRGGGYSGGRFRGRDGKAREENGFRRQGGSDRRPRSREEYRYWRSAGNELPDVHDKFVMVSYNILADKNASEHYRGLYYHIPWRLMDWDRRKNKIVQELGLWSPDVMCLQEVDQFDDLREEFEKRGYQGTYKGRTGGSRDGCAMFWRSSRFRLLQEECIEFDDLGLRNNVAQICALQSIGVRGNRPSSIEADLPDSGYPKESPLMSYFPVPELQSSGNVLLVGNIHVLFNPKRGDIKLGQVRVLLESAHALSQKWNEAPVVICGDFNSTPASSIYQYLANSELDISCLNRQNLSGQVEAGEGSASVSVNSSVRFSRSEWRNEVSQSVESRYEQSHLPAAEVAVAESDMAVRTEFASFVETNTSYEECSTSGTSVAEVFLAESSTVSESKTNEFVKRWVWTPEEIAAASGSSDETTVRHKLRLRSVYTEIEGEGGCRDPQGEPLVTTYHKKFMGTVDYIWHTEGLDTVRVLDTLPVNVLERCQGLPSQKWGSDHLALACELAFHPPS